jgi:hypothetical protein
MNITTKLTLMLATAAAACVVHADVPAASDSSAGTLGQRYGEVSFTDQDINHISNDAYDLGLGVNYPVVEHLDLGANYTYGWLDNKSTDINSNIVQANATAYLTYAGVKPFASLGLGYEWDKTSSHSHANHTGYTIWNAAVGVEIPVKPAVAITPFIAYQDDFRDKTTSAQAFDYGAEINYWFYKDWSAFADVAYQNVQHSKFDSWDWTIGLRQKF